MSLTTDNEVLDRSFATTSLFTRGDNSKLSNINLTNVKASIEPVKNLVFQFGSTFKTIKSASQEYFNMNYFDENGDIESDIKQVDLIQ